ncbi:hypothetical protein CACET_c22380 [Clostridium aceticum]|uniref:Uncharacterized protein n=1 Tax=Clostridium aceticum TaxID=84022 RepID=A0A0D8I910_9CLOT|nr:hypothetical protein [Clostridium aceticum]AKL95684.1 hypothetical protein CACET_c22380 [Clostridium aceticum]KJF26758.1 hypothetical protein TZ02_11075 [Clostridium aceticum]
MKTVYFKKKNGGISSIRTGNQFMNMTTYLDGPAGGITFKGPHMTTRFSKGQCISVGLKSGKKVTYFGKNGNVSNRINSFK